MSNVRGGAKCLDISEDLRQEFVRDVVKIVDKIRGNPPVPKKNGYLLLASFALKHLTVENLRTLMAEFYHIHRKGVNVPEIQDLQEASSQLCSEFMDEIHLLMIKLDIVVPFARHAFFKRILDKSFFSRTGIQVFEGTLDVANFKSTPLMARYTNYLRSTNESLADDRIKCNALHSTFDGYSIFILDEQDLQDISDVRACVVLYIYSMPYLFVSSFNQMPLKRIKNVFKTVFICNLKTVPTLPRDELRDVIKDLAVKQSLTRDKFSAKLQDLLEMDKYTLTYRERHPDLEKYPSIISRCARQTAIELQPGLTLMMKAKKGENLLETLYKLEESGKIVIPKNVIDRIVRRDERVVPFYTHTDSEEDME